MENQLKIKGIIIKEVKYGESSKIFSVLTDCFGVVQAAASGVRSQKSKLSTGCGMFVYSSFVMRNGKNMYNITAADCVYSFYNLRLDVAKLAYAKYFCDLAALAAADDSAGILSLLLNTLFFVENNEDIRRSKPVFELRLLEESGFMPGIFSCSVCGSADITEFSAADGTGRCFSCGVSKNISKNALAAMRYILTAESKRIFSFDISDECLSEVTDITQRYLYAQYGKPPASLEYLKENF